MNALLVTMELPALPVIYYPVYYTGRVIKLSRKGMQISECDRTIFLGHVGNTMSALSIPKSKCYDMVAFGLSLESDIVEV